jgi:hypothetical protein
VLKTDISALDKMPEVFGPLGRNLLDHPVVFSNEHKLSFQAFIECCFQHEVDAFVVYQFLEREF